MIEKKKIINVISLEVTEIIAEKENDNIYMITIYKKDISPCNIAGKINMGIQKNL